MQSPYLIGSKVYLRPLDIADAATMAVWTNDPEVRRTLRLYRPQTAETEVAFIRKAAEDEHNFLLGVATVEADRLIGCTGIHGIDFRNRQGGFGLMIGVKDDWGKGYGTEVTALMVAHAFETLNLNRVWLQVHEFNPAGIRAYEKVGFRREGVLRQDVFQAGRYWDTYTMAILREEWQGWPR